MVRCLRLLIRWCVFVFNLLLETSLRVALHLVDNAHPISFNVACHSKMEVSFLNIFLILVSILLIKLIILELVPLVKLIDMGLLLLFIQTTR